MTKVICRALHLWNIYNQMIASNVDSYIQAYNFLSAAKNPVEYTAWLCSMYAFDMHSKSLY